MFVALHTYSFRRRFERDGQTFFDAVDWAAEHGFRGLDMMIERGDRPRPVAGLPDLAPATVERAVTHAHRRGVPVLAFSTYNDFATADSGERSREAAFLRDWIRLAATCGVPRLRLLTGYYREGRDQTEQELRTRQGIADCVAAAREANVELALENHSSVFATAAELTTLVREHAPVLTLCPDPTNWVRDYFRAPETNRENIYPELALAAPFATHAHLKIRGLAPDADALVGFDLQRLLRILRDADFAGAIAFESVTFDANQSGDLLADLPAARARVEQAITSVLGERARTTGATKIP